MMMVDLMDTATLLVQENPFAVACVVVLVLLLVQTARNMVTARRARERLEAAEERIRMIENQLERMLMQRLRTNVDKPAVGPVLRSAETASPREKALVA